MPDEEENNQDVGNLPLPPLPPGITLPPPPPPPGIGLGDDSIIDEAMDELPSIPLPDDEESTPPLGLPDSMGEA